MYIAVLQKSYRQHSYGGIIHFLCFSRWNRSSELTWPDSKLDVERHLHNKSLISSFCCNKGQWRQGWIYPMNYQTCLKTPAYTL